MNANIPDATMTSVANTGDVKRSKTADIVRSNSPVLGHSKANRATIHLVGSSRNKKHPWLAAMQYDKRVPDFARSNRATYSVAMKSARGAGSDMVGASSRAVAGGI